MELSNVSIPFSFKERENKRNTVSGCVHTYEATTHPKCETLKITQVQRHHWQVASRALSLVISWLEQVGLQLLMLTSQQTVMCESPSPLVTAVRKRWEADVLTVSAICHNLSN